MRKCRKVFRSVELQKTIYYVVKIVGSISKIQRLKASKAILKLEQSPFDPNSFVLPSPKAPSDYTSH